MPYSTPLKVDTTTILLHICDIMCNCTVILLLAVIKKALTTVIISENIQPLIHDLFLLQNLTLNQIKFFL